MNTATPRSNRFRKRLALVLLGFSAACTTMPKPNQVIAPRPIPNSTGKYVAPYTSDGTVAPWVAKGRAASLGSTAGSFLGAKAGEKAVEQIPLVGGFLGRKVGEKAGRAVALKMVGGEQAMRETSDLSFNTIDDLIVFLYANYSATTDKEWDQVFNLTKQVYPEVEDRWSDAIMKAPRKK